MGISNKEKRQNYSLNPGAQAQLKQNLVVVKNSQKQVEALFNESAYSLQQKPQSLQSRKATIKANQQFVKKALGGIPFPNTSSLSTTQPIRFQGAGNQNYNTTNPTQSTSQSGMNSTTAPNAHLLQQFDTAGNPVAQASIPIIAKNSIE